MRYKIIIIVGALIAIGAAAAGALYHAFPVQMATYARMTRNYLISLAASAGTVTTELNAGYKGTGAVAAALPTEATSASATAGGWPSYNRALTPVRFSPLSQINTKNVGKLKVLCTYDIGSFETFESGSKCWASRVPREPVTSDFFARRLGG
jgi:glucose dehydrogenase